ncbi:ATP-binding protein [Flammeovirga yaeyamensis]|uniref:ATP-binding protein n=1 Tax=Flammeovirga yaeyamensis TaxID=367791 RepID=A0AAX1NBM2_9BACT|nr:MULTISPECIES: ATP-binding protein [Flammeovirga]ANQ52686.1 anti-sigma regulatory factor [Flammeovirga sp. MY04]MBB3697124.1 serine/threonine-protein kinase RsbT [Flammeovirga yaeyamensis]NMF33787.1 anti-sigma regulatory factor [Flammeovirga yaeyamensis]QWG04948.1 ATP-binding protein [Flammeovirga yaeyamensis]
MRISIQKETDIHYAQHEVLDFAKSLGFNQLDCHKISIIISELAQNIIKYVGKGFVKFSHRRMLHREGILIEAIDNGKGIFDLETALTDNFSTGGTLGLGLPGIKRIADIFEIDSIPDQGTHVKVTYWIKYKK